MQTVDITKCIEGTFVRELKNRFLCEVLIDGISTVCYVPSSCHLANFLSLGGKKVLLIPTETKRAKTKYALFAVPYKRSYILLNPSFANRAVEYNIHNRSFSMLGPRKEVFTEHTVSGYKADIFSPATKTIVEIKSVISTSTVAVFPTVFSERSIKQLKDIKEMLKCGYRIHYYIVSLNPYVRCLKIEKESQFWPVFSACRELGMEVSAFVCKCAGTEVKLKKIRILEE